MHSNIDAMASGYPVVGTRLGMEPAVCGLPGEFAAIFPFQGVERGAITALYGQMGVYTVLEEILAGATAKGVNVVCVNIQGLGAQYLRDAGADLGRVVRVDVNQGQELAVLTALVDSFEMVVFPLSRVGPKWRAIVSRVRERSTAMMVVGRCEQESLGRVRGVGGLCLEVEVSEVVWRCDPAYTGRLVVREAVRVACVRHGRVQVHEVGAGSG